MSLPQTFISVGVEEIILHDNDKVDFQSLKCETYLNESNLDTFQLGDDFSRSILPIISAKDRVRFVIKDSNTDSIVGCVSFSTELFLANKGCVITHWITLFDSPEDDEYDGDFSEDDDEAPKALFRFVVDSALNIKQLEETLLNNGNPLSTEDVKLQSTPVRTVKEEAAIQQESLSPSLEKPKGQDEECKTDRDQENELHEGYPSAEGDEDTIKEGLPVKDMRMYLHSSRDDGLQSIREHTHERDSQTEYSQSDRTQNEVFNSELLDEEDVDVQPEALSEGNHEAGNVKDSVSFDGESNLHTVTEVSDCSNKSTLPQNQELLKYYSQEYAMSKTLESHRSVDQKEEKIGKVNDAPRTPSRQEKEAELKQIKLDLEKMEEIYRENERLKNALKTKSSDYEEITKRMQTQLLETCNSIKIASEEKMALKARVKELEDIVELKNNELIELAQNVDKIQTKQGEFERIYTEKNNLRVQNLENIISDLREQLQQALTTNEQLQSSNKNISDAQNELITKLKKLNEDHSADQQIQSRKLAEMTKNLQDFQQQLSQKQQLIEEQEAQLNTYSQKVSNLEQERDLLRKRVDELQALPVESLNNLDTKRTIGEDTELNSFKQELAKMKSQNLELERELQAAKTEKSEIELELQQMKSRNYEKEIWNLRKNFELAEIARGKLQDELLNAHKNWQLIIDEQKGKSPSNNQSFSEDIENEKKLSKELSQKLREKELEVEQLSHQNNELVIQMKQTEVFMAQKEQTEREIERVKAENQELADALKISQEKYFTASEDLIKQQNYNSEQRQTIKSLNKKLQSLEKSLKNAFNDIQRLEASIENNSSKSHHHHEEINYHSNPVHTSNPPAQQLPRPKAPSQDELSRRVEQFMLKNRPPVKFVRIGDGLYNFGSKKVQVKTLNGKLVVKVGGGYVFIEQFVKTYATAELNKLNQPKETEKPVSTGFDKGYSDDDDAVVEGKVEEKLEYYRKQSQDRKRSEGIERFTNDIDEEEDEDTLENVTDVARSSPCAKRHEKYGASGLKSPENKHFARLSQRTTEIKETKSAQKEKRNETINFDTTRSATVADEIRRKGKLSKEHSGNGSPKAVNPKKSKKNSIHESQELSREVFQNKSLVDPMLTRSEKSPSNRSVSKNKLSSGNNSRDISPLQGSSVRQNKKVKELNPKNITTVQRA